MGRTVGPGQTRRLERRRCGAAGSGGNLPSHGGQRGGGSLRPRLLSSMMLRVPFSHPPPGLPDNRGGQLPTGLVAETERCELISQTFPVGPGQPDDVRERVVIPPHPEIQRRPRGTTFSRPSDPLQRLSVVRFGHRPPRRPSLFHSQTFHPCQELAGVSEHQRDASVSKTYQPRVSLRSLMLRSRHDSSRLLFRYMKGIQCADQ